MIISDSAEDTKACKHILESLYPWIKETLYVSYQESKGLTQSVDYCIFVRTSSAQTIPLKGKLSTLVMADFYDSSLARENNITQLITTDMDTTQTLCTPLSNALIAIIASFNQHQCKRVVPKYQTCNSAIFDEKNVSLCERFDQIYDFGLYMATFPQSDFTRSGALSICGSRGKPIFNELTMKDLIYRTISSDDLKKVRQKHALILQ